MIFVIGGAHQGKLEYAKKRFFLESADIYVCYNQSVDFSKKCMNALEEYVWVCIENDTNPVEIFQRNPDKWRNSVLICQDIFCGVVPLDAKQRKWRQETGKLCQYLAQNADEVIRIFCGLEQRLK